MKKPDSQSDTNTRSANDSGHRPIRSYVVRGGRLTTSQRKAIDEYWSDYVVDYRPEILDTDVLFGNPGELVVEIGFGMGDSLLAMATDRPDLNFIGIEVHQPGVGKLLHGLAAGEVANVRVICHDAREVLQHQFAHASIDRIQIFFPDPWHKKRHHKRRLIQSEFVALLASKLRPGGVLHLATDWEPYAQQMMEVLQADSCFENEAGEGCSATAGERPATRFERRGRRLGHGVWDLRFVRL